MHFLKLPLLHKTADECVTTLERWLYILKNLEHMNTIPQQFKQDPIFNRLGEGTLSWNLCDAYNQSLKNYRDNYAIAATERAKVIMM